MSSLAKNTSTYRGQWTIDQVKQVIQEAFNKSAESPAIAALAQKIRYAVARPMDVNLQRDASLVFQYIHSNIPYQRDPNRREEVKTAMRTISDAERGIGSDCEDMTILACALLYNMGHKAVRANIIAQSGGGWSHIFCSAGEHLHPHNPLIRGWVVDPVPPLEGFDQLAPQITRNMEVYLLEGIKDERPDWVRYIQDGTTIRPGQALAGVGNVAPIDQATATLMNAQSRLLGGLAGLSGAHRHAAAREARKLHTMIRLNGTPERDALMAVMPYVHDIDHQGRLVFANDAPLGAIANYFEQIELQGILEEEDDTLGKKRKKDKKKDLDSQLMVEAEKEKKGKGKGKGKQDGGLLKKAAKAIVRYNPGSIAIRNGLLLALRINLVNMADRLAYGYLTKPEAEDAKLDMSQWAEARSGLAETEKIFVKILGGKPEKLKAAILRGAMGHQKKKQLGEPVAVAGTAAASGVIAKILALLGKVKESKLLAVADKMKLGQKLAALAGRHPDTEALPSGAENPGFAKEEEAKVFETLAQYPELPAQQINVLPDGQAQVPNAPEVAMRTLSSDSGAKDDKPSGSGSGKTALILGGIGLLGLGAILLLSK